MLFVDVTSVVIVLAIVVQFVVQSLDVVPLSDESVLVTAGIVLAVSPILTYALYRRRAT